MVNSPLIRPYFLGGGGIGGGTLGSHDNKANKKLPKFVSRKKERKGVERPERMLKNS